MRTPTPSLLLLPLHLLHLTLATPPPHPRPASPLFPLLLFPSEFPLPSHPQPSSPPFARPPPRAHSLPNLQDPNPNLRQLLSPPSLPAPRNRVSYPLPNSNSPFQINCPGYHHGESCTQRCSCEYDRRLKCPPGVEICLATCWCVPWMVPVGGPWRGGGFGGDGGLGVLSEHGILGVGHGDEGAVDGGGTTEGRVGEGLSGTEGGRVGGRFGNRGGVSRGGGGERERGVNRRGRMRGPGVNGGVTKAAPGERDTPAGGKTPNTRSLGTEGLWRGLS